MTGLKDSILTGGLGYIMATILGAYIGFQVGRTAFIKYVNRELKKNGIDWVFYEEF